jgi:hypothetical protein
VWSARRIPDVSEEYSAATFSLDGGSNTTQNLVTAQETIRYRTTHTKHDKTQVFLRPLQLLEILNEKCMCVFVCVLGASGREEAKLFLCLSNTQ